MQFRVLISDCISGWQFRLIISPTPFPKSLNSNSNDTKRNKGLQIKMADGTHAFNVDFIILKTSLYLLKLIFKRLNMIRKEVTGMEKNTINCGMLKGRYTNNRWFSRPRKLKTTWEPVQESSAESSRGSGRYQVAVKLEIRSGVWNKEAWVKAV